MAAAITFNCQNMKAEDFQITKERSIKRGWLYSITHPEWAELSPSFAVADNPTPNELRRAIESVINEHTRQRITEGFVYDFGDGPRRVWLSSENQANYAAYLKAAELGAKQITLKVEDTDGAVCYQDVTPTAYTDFYLSLVAHIKTQIEHGWHQKDSIDYALLASKVEDL